jgi:hypothetical protein
VAEAGERERDRRSRSSRPAPTPSKASRRARSSSATGPRKQTRERIIEFVRAQRPATAGEVATGLNLNRNSVATRMTKLTKAGELAKAERGYATPAANGASKS